MIVKKHITWYSIPEYAIMIKCFFVELLCLNISSIGELEINTTRAVLRNHIMIKYLIQILYKKTE